MRRLMTTTIVALGFMSMAAKGGCSVQVTDDGRSDGWKTAAAPSASDAKPMTCEFLREDNCWKRFVAKVEACVGDFQAGSMSEDRKVCTAASGARLELGGAVDAPAPGNSSVVAADWRIVNAGGRACATGKILGIGRTMIDAEGEVALLESTSLLKYRVVCPDGSTYSNDSPTSSEEEARAENASDSGAASTNAGTEADTGEAKSADAGATASAEKPPVVCPTFGLDYLTKRTPGVLLSCEGTARQCKLAFWGGTTGETTVTTCAW